MIGGRATIRGNRKSEISNQKSEIVRFLRDEGGQGIIFAAATLLLLVGFVALVYNIGRVVERRTKMQLGADSAAYAGATVEGNSLSAIGWINSAMAQIYYNALKYAVDVNVAGVAAELERQLNNGVVDTSGPAYIAYADPINGAYFRAKAALPQAKQWMVDLSRIENAIAILTPRLMEEEMYAVAGEVGAERISVYPSFRMFPHQSSLISCKIERLPNGWVITNIAGGNGDSLTVTLKGSTWDLQYTRDGIVSNEVQITQDSPTQWDIQYSNPPGSMKQQINLLNDPNLGWVVWGSTGNPPSPMPPIQFQNLTVQPGSTPMQTSGGVTVNGTVVTQGGTSQVLGMGADGNVYVCSAVPAGTTGAAYFPQLNEWVAPNTTPLTSNQTTIAGVTVNVNVTNQINFPGATAYIGNPTTVEVGPARIVLNNPPNISTSFGPVQITINGFTASSFNISVGDWSLTPGDSDGLWRKYYDPINELWWRHRLVVMGMDANNQPNVWEYDHEVLGTLLRNEPTFYYPLQPLQGQPPNRFLNHVFGDRDAAYTASNPPPWVWSANSATGWFNPAPSVAAPYDTSTTGAQLSNIGPPPPGIYCQTARGPDGQMIRVTIGDLAVSGSVAFIVDPTLVNPNKQFPTDFCLTAPMFIAPGASALYAGIPKTLPPLVLAEEYFQAGVNVGVWKSPETPMLFPAPGSALNTQNAPFIFPSSTSQIPQAGTLSPTSQWWGSVAVASARVGIKDPSYDGDFRVNFSSPEEREQWCYFSPANLYLADVNVKLMPTKELTSIPEQSQVNSYDLDWHINWQGQSGAMPSEGAILQGVPVSPIHESATSYLWGAILAGQQTERFQYANWLSSFNGRSDPRVGNALSHMQARPLSQNDVRFFDFGSSGIDQVVQH